MLSIEGNPFITRFKTLTKFIVDNRLCIEGNPFITRFKTAISSALTSTCSASIEGNPFITRFKTSRLSPSKISSIFSVLKVIHL